MSTKIPGMVHQGLLAPQGLMDREMKKSACTGRNISNFYFESDWQNERVIWSTDFLDYSISISFCRLLITFANSLDPDQNRQNVGSALEPNLLTLR